MDASPEKVLEEHKNDTILYASYIIEVQVIFMNSGYYSK